jgi:hypothetical protein
MPTFSELATLRKADMPYRVETATAGVPRVDGTFLAGLVGASCLLPGLAVATVGDIAVQPVIPILAIYIVFVALLRLRLPLQPLLWMMLVLVSYVISTALSTSPANSTLYASLQGSYLLLGGIAFTAICGTAGHRRAFVRGYMGGALLSSLIGFAQAVYSIASGNAIALANNSNFSIVGAYGRGAAFTPEPSALAALLIPALLCWWLEHQAGSGLLARWQRGWLALFVLAIGLLATKSSSLLYIPALIAVVSALQCANLRAFIKGVSGIAILTIAVGGVFLHFYSSRLENNDAIASEAWRETKMLAGITIFETYPIAGAGIGRVSDPDFFAPYMDIPPDLRWNQEPRKGIDSTAIRTLAELGLLGFAATYYPIFAFFRRARTLFQTASFNGIAGLSYGLLFTQIFISGYRDQIVLWLPMVAFAIAGNAVALAYRGDRRRQDMPDDGIVHPSRLNHGSARG